MPEAEEVISYQMPAFRLNGMLVWFAAFKKHYTIFFPGKVLRIFRDELKPFELIKSGAGIRIPLGQPVPDQLIAKDGESPCKGNLGYAAVEIILKKIILTFFAMLCI